MARRYLRYRLRPSPASSPTPARESREFMLGQNRSSSPAGMRNACCARTTFERGFAAEVDAAAATTRQTAVGVGRQAPRIACQAVGLVGVACLNEFWAGINCGRTIEMQRSSCSPDQATRARHQFRSYSTAEHRARQLNTAAPRTPPVQVNRSARSVPQLRLHSAPTSPWLCRVSSSSGRLAVPAAVSQFFD